MVLVKMVEFKVVKIENNIVKALDENQIGFYCTFIMPIIETYWAVITEVVSSFSAMQIATYNKYYFLNLLCL